MFNAATRPFLEDVKICPVMTSGHETVLCQRSNCYAADPVHMTGETCMYCALIDGRDQVTQPAQKE